MVKRNFLVDSQKRVTEHDGCISDLNQENSFSLIALFQKSDYSDLFVLLSGVGGIWPPTLESWGARATSKPPLKPNNDSFDQHWLFLTKFCLWW